MIYAYTPILHSGFAKKLPLLNVRLMNNSHSSTAFTLLDSGSDFNVFSSEIMNDLGLKRKKEITFAAFGSENIPGWMAQVDYRLEFGNDFVSWIAETIFSEAATKRNVLGQTGFFDHFDVIFRREKFEFELLIPKESY